MLGVPQSPGPPHRQEETSPGGTHSAALGRWLARAGRVVFRTLSHAIPTILGIVIISFLLLNLLPGDAVDAAAGMSGSATKETTEELRRSFGLDQSPATRLWTYVGGVLTLDLGRSIHFQAPVLNVVASRMPNTLLLMLTVFVVAFVSGVLAGWVMAAFAGKWPDRLLTGIVLVLYSTPGFWLGLMAIVLFSVRLQWFPSSGIETIGMENSDSGHIVDEARHLILPALALAPNFIAVYARLTRAAMIDVLRQDYIRTAASKGLYPITLQFRHALRNALIPVTTVAGLHLGNLLGGAIVVETVFSWPGLGRLAVDALVARDYPVLLGILILSSALVIVVNIVIDWIIAWLDPRISQ
jgi:peptide/nickel transport system permease protein